MKHLALILITALGLPAMLPSKSCDTSTPVFNSSEHGVAYCTTKGTLFSRSAQVVGKNLDVDAKMSWSDVGDRTQIEVSVPLNAFKSGSKKRDKHVAEILGSPAFTGISFKSDWLGTEMLCDSIERGETSLQGTLEIKGEGYPVSFDLEFQSISSSAVVMGSLGTTFSELNVSVPKVGPGGMIAKPHDNLMLFVQLHLDKIGKAGSLQQCF